MSTQTTAPASAQWFALHTLSGQENKVKMYIEKFKKPRSSMMLFLKFCCPTEVVSEVKNGKKSPRFASSILDTSLSKCACMVRTERSSTSRGIS
jgi:transcription antitermination factor NusG